MKITYSSLGSHLKNSVSPIYLVSSDEILLQQEAISKIRATLQKHHYERQTPIDADSHWDAASFFAALPQSGLFSRRRFFELLLPERWPAAIQKYFQQQAEHPLEDVILLLIAPHLETALTKSSCIVSIAKTGLWLPIPKMTSLELPRWVETRLSAQQLQIEPAALNYFCEGISGNLLAAEQAITKLVGLSKPNTILQIDDIKNILDDAAQFDAFQCVDYALQGQSASALHAWQTLRSEGTEAILLLWSLQRTIRQLLILAYARERKEALAPLWQQQRIWPARQKLYEVALRRHTLIGLQKLLTRVAICDQRLKNGTLLYGWETLLQLLLKLSR